MSRSATLLVCVCLATTAPRLHAQDLVQSIHITGANELSDEAVRSAIGIAAGEPLTLSLEQVERRVVARYTDDGYAFARATATFDAASGALTVAVDEGVIDAVEFDGVGDRLARRFGEEFALRAGDIFNRSRAREALDALLRPTRGAIRPRGARARGAFDMVERNGERVLVVGLREPAGRLRIVPDLGDREDWFSAVDGFVPSLGMGAAVFDHDHFNHAYVSGHISIRTATDRVGYAIGFERPFLTGTRLFVGGELHDLTATDDHWQVSSAEASSDAFLARKSFRDYYRRRGVQVNVAVRVDPRAELLVAWRGERQEALASETDFSVFNGDDPFRPNVPARDGRLSAILLGASLSSDRFERESLESSYRRHQLETPFGARLNDFDKRGAFPSVWRIDWGSELSTPGLDSDFDFKRHIVTGRARVRVSPHQTFAARAIGGWSEGALPPQRQFAAGGIGSVHGYAFKEQVGDSLALVNLEYGLGWHRDFEVLGFFDAGRAAIRDTGAATPWLKGVGFGIAAGGMRLDFGYKLDAVPSSLQVLLRFGRTF